MADPMTSVLLQCAASTPSDQSYTGDKPFKRKKLDGTSVGSVRLAFASARMGATGRPEEWQEVQHRDEDRPAIMKAFKYSMTAVLATAVLSCGGGSSNPIPPAPVATPTPVVVATPTPAPTPEPTPEGEPPVE